MDCVRGRGDRQAASSRQAREAFHMECIRPAAGLTPLTVDGLPQTSQEGGRLKGGRGWVRVYIGELAAKPIFDVRCISTASVSAQGH